MNLQHRRAAAEMKRTMIARASAKESAGRALPAIDRRAGAGDFAVVGTLRAHASARLRPVYKVGFREEGLNHATHTVRRRN